MRAGMVERAEAYPWSSAAAHCGMREDTLLSPDFPPAGVIEDWGEWLFEEREDDERCERIRRQTHTGRPCGSPGFLDQLERLLGRILRPKKGGRPRKEENPCLSLSFP